MLANVKSVSVSVEQIEQLNGEVIEGIASYRSQCCCHGPEVRGQRQGQLKSDDKNKDKDKDL